MGDNAKNKNVDLIEVVDLLNKYIDKVCDEAAERHNITLFLERNIEFLYWKEKRYN